MPKGSDYTGRFAPSPSGPLHIGSLIAALASYLDAKANKGTWYVRMEDLDPPRESPEAAKHILKTLEQLHLFWDGSVLYQSQRHPAYAAALASLKALKLTFPCTCSRQKIQASGGVHNGICQPEAGVTSAIRCLSSDNIVTFNDIFQSKQSQNLLQEAGDFVIKRKDGLYAYQLAVALDDAYQDITHTIRGIDLLESTGRQIYLQSLLGLSTPTYGHIPVIVNEQGQKLSKQHFAQPINPNKPQQVLFSALTYLQQKPDPMLLECKVEDILTWGINNWQPDQLKGLDKLPLFEG